MKVLIVEDEALISMWVEDTLLDAGYEVVATSDADQAVLALEHDSSIRIVFTDIDMPGTMNGLLLASLVRRRWPPINLIVASGKQNPTAEELPDSTVFLTKPYLSEEVLSAVRNFAVN